MPEPVSLEEIKQDLKLDLAATGEDVRLQRLIKAARRSLELKTGRSIVGEAPSIAGADLELAVQAISMIVATWYALPEGVSVDGRAGSVELPLGVGWIIEQLKRWDDGGEA